MPEIIFIIFSSLCLLAISYLAGSLALLPFMDRVNQQGPNVSFFFKVHAGLWALTTAVAIYYTSGKTILSYLVLAYLYFVVKKGKRQGLKIKIEYSSFGLFSAVLPCFVVWQAVRSGFFTEEIAHLGDVDYGIYITVAEYLRQTGIENPSPWYALAPGAENLPLTPYHYGDLWMNHLFGLWGRQIAPFYWYNLSFIPFLGSLSCFICLVLVEKLVGRKLLKWEKLIALLLPFSVGWLYVLYPKVAFILSPFVQAKSSLIFLLITNGLLFWTLKKRFLFFFCLSSFFIINIVYAPVLVSGAILFDWLLQRKIRWDNSFFILLAPPAYFLSFYTLFGTFDTAATPVFPGWQDFLRSAAKIGAYTTLYFVIFNFPLVVIGWMLYSARIRVPSKVREILLFLACLYFCSSALWAVSTFLVDSFLFYTVLANQFSIVLYLILFSVALKQRGLSLSVKVILGVHLFLSLIFLAFYYDQKQSGYGRDFIAETRQPLYSLRPLGAYLPNETEMDVWEADPRMCIPCNFLKAIGPNYWAFSISVPEDISQTAFPERMTAIMAAPFYQYIQQLKERGAYQSYEEAQLAFLKEANVEYVVVEKGAFVPETIRDIAVRELKDSLSGTRVLILSADY